MILRAFAGLLVVLSVPALRAQSDSVRARLIDTVKVTGRAEPVLRSGLQPRSRNGFARRSRECPSTCRAMGTVRGGQTSTSARPALRHVFRSRAVLQLHVLPRRSHSRRPVFADRSPPCAGTTSARQAAVSGGLGFHSIDACGTTNSGRYESVLRTRRRNRTLSTARYRCCSLPASRKPGVE